jgi:hypothetical protein
MPVPLGVGVEPPAPVGFWSIAVPGDAVVLPGDPTVCPVVVDVVLPLVPMLSAVDVPTASDAPAATDGDALSRRSQADKRAAAATSAIREKDCERFMTKLLERLKSRAQGSFCACHGHPWSVSIGWFLLDAARRKA